jgi:hypothetical protein
MAWLLGQKNAIVKRIRSDNGREYMGKEFQDICAKFGIIHETTSPYTHQNIMALLKDITELSRKVLSPYNMMQGFLENFGSLPCIQLISSRNTPLT